MTAARKPAPTFPLRLPPSIRSRIERLAKDDGVSLNQYIATTLAEKIGASQERSFFADRKANADFDDLRNTTLGSERHTVSNSDKQDNDGHGAGNTVKHRIGDRHSPDGKDRQRSDVDNWFNSEAL